MVPTLGNMRRLFLSRVRSGCGTARKGEEEEEEDEEDELERRGDGGRFGGRGGGDALARVDEEDVPKEIAGKVLCLLGWFALVLPLFVLFCFRFVSCLGVFFC